MCLLCSHSVTYSTHHIGPSSHLILWLCFCSYILGVGSTINLDIHNHISMHNFYQFWCLGKYPVHLSLIYIYFICIWWVLSLLISATLWDTLHYTLISYISILKHHNMTYLWFFHAFYTWEKKGNQMPWYFPHHPLFWSLLYQRCTTGIYETFTWWMTLFCVSWVYLTQI